MDDIDSAGVGYFNEDRAHSGATPDFQSHYNFDWEALARALGESKEQTGKDFEQMAQGLRVLLIWILNISECRHRKKPTGSEKIQQCGMRIIALAWTLDPGLLDGKSLRGVERLLGLYRNSLSPLSKELKDTFGLRGAPPGRGGADHREKFQNTPDPEKCP